MHDFYLAQEIIDKIIKHARQNKLSAVQAVKIELGAISEHNEEISPANLKYWFAKITNKNSLFVRTKFTITTTKNKYYKITSIKGSE